MQHCKKEWRPCWSSCHREYQKPPPETFQFYCGECGDWICTQCNRWYIDRCFDCDGSDDDLNYICSKHGCPNKVCQLKKRYEELEKRYEELEKRIRENYEELDERISKLTKE